MAGTNLSNIFTRSEQLEVQKAELDWQKMVFFMEMAKSSGDSQDSLALLFLLMGGGDALPPPTNPIDMQDLPILNQVTLELDKINDATMDIPVIGTVASIVGDISYKVGESILGGYQELTPEKATQDIQIVDGSVISGQGMARLIYENPTYDWTEFAKTNVVLDSDYIPSGAVELLIQQSDIENKLVSNPVEVSDYDIAYAEDLANKLGG